MKNLGFKNSLLFLALTFTFGSGSLIADDTPPYSFRLDSPGGSMEKIRVKRQYESLCAAHAASDMVDAWRLSHPEDYPVDQLNYRTSPLEAAIGYKHSVSKSHFAKHLKQKGIDLLYSDPKYPYNFNLVNGIIDYLRQNGSCPAYLRSTSQSSPFILECHLNTIKHFYLKYAKSRSIAKSEAKCRLQMLSANDSLYDITNILRQEDKPNLAHTIAEEAIAALKKELYPDIPTVPELAAIFQESNSIKEMLYKFISLRCSDRKELKLPGLKISHPKNEEALKGLLIAQFQKQRPQPLAIDICSSIHFMPPNYTGKLVGTGLPKPNCYPHTTLIIGLQYHEERKQWEALIQETMGNNFDSFFVAREAIEKEEKTFYHFIRTRERPEKVLNEKLNSYETYAYFSNRKKAFALLEFDNYEELLFSGSVAQLPSRGYRMKRSTRVVPSGKFWIPLNVLVRNTFEVYHWND